MTVPGTLLIRCDASIAMGTGHAMRCLALAQAWQDEGGKVTFAMAETTASMEARLRRECADVLRVPGLPGSAEDSARTCDLALRGKAEWVVVDGYQFGSAYQSAIRAAGLKLLLIDDQGAAAPYSADLVLNQNVHAKEDLYRERAPHTQLLLGPRYIVLRREFAFWRKRTFEIAPRARRILVTMGGSDPENLTEQILKVLLTEPDLELTVVVGGSNPHLASIERRVEEANCPVRLLKDVSDMPALMVWADLVIAGAGTTSWELCMMGSPAVLCVLAPNQEKIAGELARLGAAVNLGYAGRIPADKIGYVVRELLQSQAKRKRMSARGRELVDGRGAERVLAFLWGDPVLRRTIESDCRNCWEWRNDPAAHVVSQEIVESHVSQKTRNVGHPARNVGHAASLPREAVAWERYMEWFRARLADPQSMLYTAMNRRGDPMGMVHCQLDGTRAVLSINVSSAFRGKGNGRKIVLLAIEELFRTSGVRTIDAFVRISNRPSIRLFERAGFRKVGIETVLGDQAIRYVLHKSVGM
jgi:UDP-2,4-diacetamido-2,4,6-trideoxy-beta-L-altropyranose hydrolase